ncbi:ParB/RepB/Spo0J family partition protein [Demequina gelatinilytica]|uniref:ParB/RepB/Spo0J family partition protein n=1 Tax=Demequina gelatinilytica TaxID=1638980 RepID=UPI0007807522|nr:ParB/RepB/Spo0J family partition protein [Demequina gelatinilytica]
MPTKKRTSVTTATDVDVDVALDTADLITERLQATGLVAIDPHLIDPHPRNPRKELGDLTELSASIAAHGIRQPLTVVPHPDDPSRFRAVIGHRRRAAAIEAGFTVVPALIDHELDEAGQLELMLLENIQRVDLNVIEEGTGYQGLLDLGVTQARIASETGRAASTVAQRIKVASLPENLHAAVLERQCTLEEAADFAGLPERDDVAFAKAIKAVEAGKKIPGYAIQDALTQARRRERLARAKDLAAEFDFDVTMKSEWEYSPKVSLGELEWTPKQHHKSGCDGGLLCTSDYYLGGDTLTSLGRLICVKPDNHAKRREELAAIAAAKRAAQPERVESDEDRADREEIEQLERDINAATEGRRAWVAALFLPAAEHVGPMRAALAAYATDIVKTGRRTINVHLWGDTIIDDVLADSVKGPDRLATLALLSATEALVPTDPWGWERIARSAGYNPLGAAQGPVHRYLTTLRDIGYELTPRETDLVTALADLIKDAD